MNLGLENKSVLVTGASQGLGLAIAQQFVNEQAQVYICARQAETITAAAAKIGAHGYVCDLTQADSIAALFKQLPGIDILVTNGGGPKAGQFTTITDDEWFKAFELTFMSVVRLIHAVTPHMHQQHWGRIICLTSSSIHRPIDNLITSNALRRAVVGLAQTLAKELAQSHITVNVVAPGMYQTQRLEQLIEQRAERSGYMFAEESDRLQRTIPLGRFGEPRELAQTVVWLASEAASYVTGSIFTIDGGLSQTQ